MIITINNKDFMSLWIHILIKTPTDKKVLNQLNLELHDLRCLNAIFIHSCFIDSTTWEQFKPWFQR